MRTIWKGTIRFGEVAIPVGLAPTVAKGDVAFKTLHRECGNPTQRASSCPVHGQVPVEELVKGYEVAEGQYVLVEDAELAELAPEGDRSIRIVACLAEQELDPNAVQSRYFLVPGDSPLGRRPYLLLHGALTSTGAVALARFAAFNSEWVATIRPLTDEQGRGVLLLERRVPQEDLLPVADVEKLLAGAEAPDETEERLAVALVHQLKPFRLRKALLGSDHRHRVRQLVDAKLAGQPLVQRHVPKQAKQTSLAVDLSDALQRSLKPARPEPRRPRRALTKR